MLLPPALGFYFAEFLDNASSAGLRILSSSTCVGLRYGYGINNSGFSGRMAHGLHYSTALRITDSQCRPDLPTRLVPCLHRAFPSRLPLSLRVPTVLLYRTTGISPCCPSATAPVLTGPHSSVIPHYRNLPLLSIGYGSRPRLRPRLTQSRSALLWKPWIFGLEDSHLYLATHSGILLGPDLPRADQLYSGNLGYSA